jgi:hypothetical protein
VTVGCGKVVSVGENDVTVGSGGGGLMVLVAGPQATSRVVKKMRIFLNTLSYS